MSKFDEMKAKAKEKAEAVKAKMENVKKQITDFVAEEPGVVLSVLSTLGTVGVAMIASAGANAERRKDMCHVEDDVTGQDFMTKHPMTNGEILELGERMIDGQTKGDALNEMGLLKKEKKRR